MAGRSALARATEGRRLAGTTVVRRLWASWLALAAANAWVLRRATSPGVGAPSPTDRWLPRGRSSTPRLATVVGMTTVAALASPSPASEGTALLAATAMTTPTVMSDAPSVKPRRAWAASQRE